MFRSCLDYLQSELEKFDEQNKPITKKTSNRFAEKLANNKANIQRIQFYR